MQPVAVERQPPVRLVRLNAGKRNALTIEAVEALRDALGPDEQAPVAVLSGRDDGFCAGLDNATLAAGDTERESLLAAMGELLLSLLTGPTRLVAVCEGHAVAAGAMLLLVSDLRLGAPGSYQIGFTEMRLGMPLPELPALLARQRLDRRRLHSLAVLGRTVGPEEAADAGFLDRVVVRDELPDTALDSARDLAVLSDTAYRGSLRAVWGSALDRVRSLVGDQLRRRDAALRRTR